MFASTNVFTASPLFGAAPSVETVNGTPPIVRVENACAVALPAEFDMKVIVHCPLEFVLGPAFVHVPAPAA